MTERLYVIWSIEHDAWWAPGHMGYVLDVALAGRYSLAEAGKILERANYPPGIFHECMIPVEALETAPLPPEFASPHDMAVNFDGTPLPLSPLEVRKHALEMFDEGKLVAVIVERGDDVSVQVMGPPDQRILEILQQALDGYRTVLRGH